MRKEEKYMKEIFIRHNPYKLATTITIDGQPLKENSSLNFDEQRLQEWIEDFPDMIVEECNMKEFNIKFHGTSLDYEDVVSVSKNAQKKGIKITTEHIPSKEAIDKEHAIENVFEKIQKGPFEELKQKDVIEAFEKAKSSEFPVSVVATMSAGKSTLINAMLNQKLMPAKQEACTATITVIRDNDGNKFDAHIYNKDDELIEEHEELTLEIMDTLNKNPNVSKIVTEGDIPFVNSKEMKLELIDTPGPNNSRDLEHKAATYRMLNNSSKTLILYILNATQLAVNDDNELLSYVAESMKVKGKQSKDRFIFVLNKLDEFKDGEDKVTDAIEKVRKYLEDKGIENPNIFPASAITALDIRTNCKDIDFSNQEIAKIVIQDAKLLSQYSKILTINDSEQLHLEKYSPLAPSINEKISGKLTAARANNDIKSEALIHTGIPSVEEAIRVYVEKYARTAKIRNIVDTFSKKLESAKSFEKTKEEITKNQEKNEELKSQLNEINKNIKNGNEAKHFKKIIDELNYDSEIGIKVDNVKNQALKDVRLILETNNNKLEKHEAENLLKVYSKRANEIQAKLQVELEKIIEEQVQGHAQELLKQYETKISMVASNIGIGDIKIDAFEFIKGETNALNKNLINEIKKKETYVKEKSKKVKNDKKKWYKPWTWFQDEWVYTKEVLGEREYIDKSDLAKKFFAPLQGQIVVNSNEAKKYAKNQTQIVKDIFKEKFEELDAVLLNKLEELNLCAKDAENAEKRLKETQEKLNWLENIQTEIESILEI